MASAKEIGRQNLNQLLGLYQQLFHQSDWYNQDAGEIFRLMLGQGGLGNVVLGDAARAFAAEELEKFRSEFNLWDRMKNPLAAPTLPNEIQNLLNQYQSGIGTALSTFAPGSDTVPQQTRDILLELARGSTPEMQKMLTFGQGMLDTRGFTPEMSQLQGTLGQILDSGGWSQALSALAGQGYDLISSGGMTEDMRRMLDLIEQGMKDQGMTPESRALYDEVMKIVQAGGEGGALMPIDAVLSMARDAAATASAQRAEAARRSANQRLGGAIGAGTAEQVMAEFADEAARGEAQAVREAALAQQGLRLQQLQSAMGVGADIAKAAQALLAAYAGSGADIMRSAASNIATGGQMAASANQAAVQSLLGAISGLNQLNSIAGGNMAQALAALESLTGAKLGATSNLNNLISQSYNALTALGSLYGGTYMGQQEMAQKNLMGDVGAWLQSIGMTNDILNSFDQKMLAAASGLAGLGGQYASNLGAGLGAYSSVSHDLIQAAMQPGFWSTFLQNVMGQATGAALGGFGELIGGRFGTGWGNVLGGKN